MGCAASCIQEATMSLFGRSSNNIADDDRAKLERKLYVAKESPEPEFDLSDCNLRQIPSGTYSICKVYRKEYIYLHKNDLHSLEDGGQLSDLYLIKVLNISSNKFSHLPSDIKYLVNVTELYVSDNMLKNITDNIQYMENLQVLDVSNNKLKSLTPVLGKLKYLRKLNITGNRELTEICPELCFARNLICLELDMEYITFPPVEICQQGTREIMRYLCNKMNVEYSPAAEEIEVFSIRTSNSLLDPFAKAHSTTWEEQEASIVAQENKIHKIAKEQREKFLSKVLQEQLELDSEIAKVHEQRETERQRLIKAIQDDEKEIECLVNNFIQFEYLKPEIIQQQLAHEQAEHERLLEITKQNYDNVKKSEILKAMEMLLEEDRSIQYSKKHYEDSLNNIKQSMLMQDAEIADKVTDLIKAKDQSRTVLVQQFLEDQDIQKAIVASLLERVDARSWSLNQEISLISSHLARLSVIEQEKKKLHIAYNYNELLNQRVQLVNFLDDLFNQQNKRRKQLIQTVKEMENEKSQTNDFWLKNYQKLIESAPKTLLDVGKCLDPVFANYLLQEGVIHCLPFLVKFLFSGDVLSNITLEKLKESGVSLSADRDAIMRAINFYIGIKNSENSNANYEQPTSIQPSAPIEDVDENNCTGVVNVVEESTLESECVICMDAKCEVVFIPCGHMCCCKDCGGGVEDCPMCRCSIERTIKVMMA
ncbi:E3 ubiquitin-protein ligase LRSAM1-like [Bombyx mandarina]|uniref:RING-type domain-containing protein n=2 Tax=Bombyx TaxID=7090 RepID=A0A8R2C7A9_BOMMO|nr:E3 ubiquitin-protein ligase LRSAM1 [Bombyx mori]XP_028025339.1 E3 ubiquitin-protein ligase LRSAM1-like [Bombyx mandarina]